MKITPEIFAASLLDRMAAKSSVTLRGVDKVFRESMYDMDRFQNDDGSWTIMGFLYGNNYMTHVILSVDDLENPKE